MINYTLCELKEKKILALKKIAKSKDIGILNTASYNKENKNVLAKKIFDIIDKKNKKRSRSRSRSKSRSKSRSRSRSKSRSKSRSRSRSKSRSRSRSKSRSRSRSKSRSRSRSKSRSRSRSKSRSRSRSKSRSKSRSRSRSKSRSKSVSPRKCFLPEDCEKNSKKYKIDYIRKLAIKCGIDIKRNNKYKLRKELCQEIKDHNQQKRQLETKVVENTSKEQLMKKTLVELKKLLKQQGIDRNINKTKKDIVEDYLLAPKCNPVNDINCPGDMSCDVRSEPGLCIPKDKKEKRLEEMIYNGKRIVGDKKSLEHFRERLKNKNIEKQSVVPQVEVIEKQSVVPQVEVIEKQSVVPQVEVIEKQSVVPQVEVIEKQSVVPQVEVIEKQSVVPQVEVIEKQELNSEDIESVLTDIKTSCGIGDLTEIQKKILKCIGLLSE